MGYLVIVKDKTPMAFNRNHAIECAMRTLCKITGKQFYSDDLIMACKCPDKMGDMTTVHRFYEYYPSVTVNNQDIYDENEAAKRYLEEMGGTKIGVGYVLVTDLCERIYMEYSIIPDKYI